MNLFEHTTIRNSAYPFDIAADNIILLAGEVPDYVYWLESGEALVRELLPDGQWRILHRILPGEVFGHYEIIAGERLICSVFARSKCTGRRIGAAEFLHLLKTQPDICFSVLQDIAKTLSSSSINTIDKAGNSVLLRVASCIHNNSRPKGAFDLTRQEIADRTRCSLRSVYRAVKTLIEDSVVENNSGTLRVGNPQKLADYINSLQR